MKKWTILCLSGLMGLTVGPHALSAESESATAAPYLLSGAPSFDLSISQFREKFNADNPTLQLGEFRSITSSRDQLNITRAASKINENLYASTALERGTVDGACITLDELLRARDNGMQLTAVLVFNISAGADHVLARRGITSIRQLAGKRIAVERSALGDLMLHLSLQAAGLDCTQVQVVPMTPDNHHQVWQAGQVDAMVCYEPIASQLQHAGAHSIFDSRSLPGMIVDLLAVRTDLLDQYTAQLRSLTNAHFRACHHLLHFPQDAAYKLAERLKLTARGVLETYRGLELPNVSANRRYLAGPSAQLLATVRTLGPIMQRHGQLKQAASLEALLDARFLPAKDL